MIDQVCSMALTIAHHDGAVRVERPRQRHDDDRGGHGRRRRLHPRGEPRSGDPRGRSRSSRARVDEGRGVHAALDPHARQLARASPGAREGGALQPLPQRRVRPPGVGPRRDGRRARLLRRELERRRRRRPVHHRAGRVHGRRVRDGPRDGRRHASRRRVPGGRARPRDEALRAHRHADHEPHRRGRPVRPEPDRGRPRRPRQASHGGPDPGPGVRRPFRTTGRPSSRSQTRSSSSARSSATTSCGCSTGSSCSCPSSTTRRKRRGRRREDVRRGRRRPAADVRHDPSRHSAERARRSAYRYRFAAIYFVLAAVVGAGVARSSSSPRRTIRRPRRPGRRSCPRAAPRPRPARSPTTSRGATAARTTSSSSRIASNRR